ncbi:uncharacterized protein ACMZJ9_017080 [Mantella aurantiaca]
MAGDNVAQSKLSGGCCNKSTVIQIIFFLIWTALGVALIVVGAINLNACPLQRYIPIYMIVAGAFSFAYWIVLPLQCFCPTLGKIFGILVALFMFAWFIAGNVWVFSIYRPPNIGCNTQAYLLVFSILIIQWIFIGFGVIGALISCFCCKNSCFSEMFSCFDCCPCSGDSQCLDCCNSCQCLECCKSCQCLECCNSCQCMESCSCLQCCKCMQCSSCLNCSQCCKCLECCATKA